MSPVGGWGGSGCEDRGDCDENCERRIDGVEDSTGWVWCCCKELGVEGIGVHRELGIWSELGELSLYIGMRDSE
jgi:hypothetical protein